MPDTLAGSVWKEQGDICFSLKKNAGLFQMSECVDSEAVRVAWVFPTLSSSSRWQPILAATRRVLPNTAFFSGFWPGFIPGYENSFQVGELQGVRSITLRTRKSGAPSRFFWAPPWVLRDIAKFRPAVIVTNGFTLLTAYLVLLKLTIGCRIIVLWQGISPETGGGPRSLRLLFRRLFARHVDLLISNTSEGAEYLLNAVQAARHKVVHRVFEVAEREALIGAAMQDGSSHYRSRKPVFLFVGRLIRGKGVHKLLEACSLLIHKGVDNFSVVIVGEGKHGDEFRRFTNRSGLAPHIQWAGPVGYKQLGAYYDSCDVFVLPSLEDTWGVVIMEAMTMGKPVLCSARAGVREMVAHGVNGFIFDPENPSALADYMESLITDQGLRRQFGAASFEIVRRYTPQNVAMMFASYFRQLAA